MIELNQQRILFVTPYLGGGGAERQLMHIANGSVDAGYEAAVFCFRPGGSYATHLDSRVEQFHPERTVASSLKGTILGLKWLKRCIQNYKPTLIVTFLNHMSVAAWWLTKANPACKRIVCIQNNFEEEVRSSFGPMTSRVFKGLMKRACRAAHGIVYISEGVKQGFEKSISIGNVPSRVIYNITGFSRPLGLNSSLELPVLPTIIACGRLHPQKDYPTLLSGFNLLRKRVPCKLQILGTGSQLQTLQELTRELQIEDLVEFLGFRDHPDHYIAQSQLFVLASRYEGFGNVIVEAMSLGVPVVSTDCPYGPGEIIKDRLNGLLVPVGDAERLADCMEQVLSNRDLANTMRSNGLVRARDFCKDHIVPQYMQFFHQITGANASQCTMSKSNGDESL
jgi:glycosyltransferase involved in cell wall biosynthesis